MKRQIVFGLTIAALSLIASASSAEKGTKEQCVHACNVTYTKMWQDCHGVTQCQAYVEHDALVCIRHCQ